MNFSFSMFVVKVFHRMFVSLRLQLFQSHFITVIFKLLQQNLFVSKMQASYFGELDKFSFRFKKQLMTLAFEEN
jgi:hypothetical protein